MKIGKLLFTLFLISASTSVFAGWSHGGQIEWESLGNDSFLVKVTVYRDCNGVQVSNSAANLSSTCGTKNLTMTHTSMSDITPVCKTLCTRCDSRGCTFKFGVQKHIYTGIVSLADWRKSSCCRVAISWGRCCRSSAITTGAAMNNFYMEADMNICDSNLMEISYPKDPATLACLGRDLFIDHFQISTNNATDSIVYELWEPLQYVSSRTTWSSAYSYEKPIYFLGFPKTSKILPQGFHVDAQTGRMAFRPMKEESTILGMKASIWRNGVYMGSVMREHGFTVMKCPDNNPPVLYLNCGKTAPRPFIVCPGDSFNLSFCTSDKDKDDSVRLSWNHSIPGLSVTIDNPGDRLDRASVSWKPDSLQARTAPYLLRITIRDQGCPISAIITKVYKIYVRPRTGFDLSVENQGCGTYEFIAQGKDSALFKEAIWSFSEGSNFQNTDTALSDTIIKTFDAPGYYPYTFATKHLEHCNFSRTDSVFVTNDFLQIKLAADSIRACENTTIKLKARAIKATGNTRFVWSTGDTTFGVKSKTITTFGSQKNWVSIAAKDSFCNDTARLLLIPNLNPDFTFSGTYVSCKGDTVVLTPTFSNSETDVSVLTSYRWLDSTNTLLSDTSLVYNALSQGNYQLQLMDTAGCSSQNQVLVQHVIPEFNMVPDTSNCINEKITLEVSSTETGRFDWYVGSDTTANARMVFNNTSKAEFNTLVSEDITVQFGLTRLGVSCTSSKTSHLKVNPLPQFQIVHNDSICHRDSVLLTSHSSATWQMPNRTLTGKHVWYYAQSMKHDNTGFKTVINATDSNGCFKDTQLVLYHLRSPKSGFIAPDSVKKNAPFVIDNETVSASQNICRWSIGNPSFLNYDTYQPSMRIDSLGLFEVHLKVLDSISQCTDASSGFIRVVKNDGVEVHFSSHFEIYPNPGTGIFYLNSKNVEDYQYRIYGLSGKEIASGTATQTSIIDLQENVSGMYIIRVIAPSGTYTTLLEKL